MFSSRIEAGLSLGVETAVDIYPERMYAAVLTMRRFFCCTRKKKKRSKKKEQELAAGEC